MTYAPDQKDLLIGEAMDLGGRALVNDLGERAGQLAAMVLGWDGTPPEPKHYRATWLLSFRQLLDDHRVGVERPKPDPAPVVTSEDGKAALAHERQQLAEALRSALDTLTDTELREYLDGVATYLQRKADEAL